jgi:hypothetical protein
MRGSKEGPHGYVLKNIHENSIITGSGLFIARVEEIVLCSQKNVKRLGARMPFLFGETRNRKVYMGLKQE